MYFFFARGYFAVHQRRQNDDGCDFDSTLGFPGEGPQKKVNEIVLYSISKLIHKLFEI